MPNIKGIDLSDGVTILDAADIPHQYSEADIVAYLQSHSIEQTEQQAANWLNANVFDGTNDQCAVKILSVSPLKVTCIVAIKNYSLPEGDPVWDEDLQAWVQPYVTYTYQIPDGWWL